MKNNYYTINKDKSKLHLSIYKFPDSLYQFRSINEYSTNALLDNGIWATIPEAFNDPYDSYFTYNEKNIKSQIECIMANKFVEVYELSKENFKVDSIISNIYQNTIDALINVYRKFYAVSCFSETIQSEIMWAHYANSAKGFAVEYDGNELYEFGQFDKKQIEEKILKIIDNYVNIKDTMEFSPLAPVIYNNHKYNIDNFIVDSVNQLLPLMIKYENGDPYLWGANLGCDYHSKNKEKMLETFYSIMLVKSKQWSYEKEWRLIVYNDNPLVGKKNDTHVYLPSIKPKAIYLGERISKYDKIALTEIAKNHLNIAVYQMQTRITSGKCRLVPVRC